MVLEDYKKILRNSTKIIFGILLLNILINISYAHESENESDNIDDTLAKNALIGIIIAGIISGTLVLIAIIFNKSKKKTKVILFLGIAIPIIIATLYSAITTVYINQTSITKGPVHWHADYEVWICDKKLDLIDPSGISNRVGTPVFHEHNDNRIHVEGVVTKLKDITLEKFFGFIGGDLHKGHIKFSTNNGLIEKSDGDLCSNQMGKLQVFVYKTFRNQLSHQEKIRDYENYILAPYPKIPPGDCIIIEFDEEKAVTERICTTYRLAIERGEIIGN